MSVSYFFKYRVINISPLILPFLFNYCVVSLLLFSFRLLFYLSGPFSLFQGPFAGQKVATTANGALIKTHGMAQWATLAHVCILLGSHEGSRHSHQSGFMHPSPPCHFFFFLFSSFSAWFLFIFMHMPIWPFVFPLGRLNDSPFLPHGCSLSRS